MKIAVLVKQVPDTETKIKIRDDRSGIAEDGTKYVVSPYDEFAIEEAIQSKGKVQGAETAVLSVGPARVVESLRTALAMGIDKAIHIDDEGKILDSWMTASVLAAVIREKGFDLIFCGKQAIDNDNSQVPAMIAEILSMPQVMIVEKFELDAGGNKARVTRRVSGGSKEVYESALPLIIGCEKGLNSPRYASLPGIMKAKSKPVEKLQASACLGEAAALTSFGNYRIPPERSAGRKITGEPAVCAAELAKLLREEAKVI